MAWVRFSRSFTFTPAEDSRSSVHYLAGHAVSVRADCKRAAVTHGAAEHFPAPLKADPRIKLTRNGVRYIAPEDL